MSVIRRLSMCIALVALAGVVQAASLTRTSKFDYFPVTGILSKEAIEPGSSNLCVVTTHDYDVFGNKTYSATRNCDGSAGEALAPTGDSVIAPRDATTGFDAQGRFATSATNSLGHTETRVYDTRFGTATSLTGPNNLTTTWTFDTFGRKTLETRSDGNKTQFDYLYCGGTSGGTAVCPAGGKYVVVTTPKNSAGTANGSVSKSYYDMLSREIRSETEGFNGTLVFKDTQYDSLGRVLQTSTPYFNGGTPVWITYTYDDLNRVLTETQPAATSGGVAKVIKTANTYNGLTTTVTVNNNGTTADMPEVVNQTKTTTRNSQGQTVRVADTQGNTVEYTYDPFSNPLTTKAGAIAGAGGIVTTMTYDLRGRKLTMADPDMGSWTYVYDVVGQLKGQTTAKAQVSTMVYDELGRMTTRTEPDLISNFTYDWCPMSVGKPCEAYADNGFYRALSYDTQGRVSQIYSEIDSPTAPYLIDYAYDANGRLAQTTYPENNVFPPDVIVKNVYNVRGYLTQVINAAGTLVYWAAGTVSATGKVLTDTLGNAATTTRGYDALDRMTSNVVTKSAVNLQNQTYAYDTIGNLTQRMDVVQANLTESFAYDRLNRLLQSSGTGLTTRSYGYDKWGDITSKSDAGTYNYPLATAAHPHSPNSITGTVNGFVNPGFTYDANGNIATGMGRTYTYTSYNMPATISGVRLAAGTSYSYTYTYNTDHQRTRLVHSTLGTFIYLHPDGAGKLLYEKEVKPTGVIEHKNYINAGGIQVGVLINRSDGSTEMRYFHQDNLGSNTLITNSTGGVMERLAYEAYGKRRNANGTADPNNTLFGINTDRGFTGHEELDEIALIHMNGRLYDPVLARFITPDPTLQAPDNLQSYNRYTYGFNNPLSGYDPTGYSFWKKWWRPIAAITAAVLLQPELSYAFISSAVASAGAGLTLEGLSTVVTIGNALGSVTAGFAGGLINGGGDFKAGLQGALTAGLFFGVGELGLGAGSAANVAAHAAVGCASSAASGGRCGSGAMGAGFGEFAG
ncbi:MAG: Flagellar hook-length control protein FliK, partial [Betaproteobacteria bacterium]|nr:Flagellar hook-length control protein FliK [Betaproteobacteria bacterium]